MSPETAASIDQIQVTLNAGGMNTINIVLAFVMFGVSLGIKPANWSCFPPSPASWPSP